MIDRPLHRLHALLVLLAPATALAQAKVGVAHSMGRTLGWYALGVIDVLALAGLAFMTAKVLGTDSAQYRTRALVVAAVAALLGVAAVVMGETEPVVHNPFLDQDTIDTIETAGYGQLALGIACGLLAFYAQQVAAAFSGPQTQRPLDIEPPPPVEPARPSLRKRAQS